MIRFDFSVDGIPAFDRAFNRIEKEIDDLRFVWPAVSAEIYSIEREQFASEGAAGASGKWAALTKAYAKFKAVRFPNQPILKATTSLFDSVTSSDAPDSIFRPERGALTIGTQREGAVWHQRGSGKMPRRRIYDFSDKQKRQVQKAIQLGLVQFIRRQGFQVEGNSA